jgi:NADH:ubiquinone oxidoreductase subunit D
MLAGMLLLLFHEENFSKDKKNILVIGPVPGQKYSEERVEGVGIIDRDEVINWGLSGPMLRASGIQWDLRKVDHYECYDELDWEVQWQKEGDSLARYLVRSQFDEYIQ